MLKTLIVDGSAIFRHAFKNALCRRFPHMVLEEASDAREAMEKVRTHDPGLVFMDISLPDGSGLELLESIKATDPDIAVIVLSSHDLAEYREASSCGGAYDFIPKGSLNLTEIATMIESIFKGDSTHLEVQMM
jgi:DNA-binding NarL/FixJ family response regulator